MSERDEDGIHVRAIRRAGLAILGGIVFAILAAWWLLQREGPAANTDKPPSIPAPRLQPAPQEERAAYFAEKEQRLNGIGWVDRGAGIAHIPIDEAMRMMAARTRQRQETKP